jgi:6-pyruvoyltetrahydropterin/6-carboxytetrahydropterin synthase
MTYTISKRFDFCASHVLDGLPEGHQCGRLHGHNYGVELELSATTLDKSGFVVDYGALASFKDFLDDVFDHRHLNDFIIVNPTAENLARLLFNEAESMGHPVKAVRVYETPKTMAEFRP